MVPTLMNDSGSFMNHFILMHLRNKLNYYLMTLFLIYNTKHDFFILVLHAFHFFFY